MEQIRINRTTQTIIIFITTFIFIFIPSMTRFSIENGQLTTELEQPTAYASLADVSILQVQHLDASYEGGKLILDLNGSTLANIGAFSNSYFYYWLPPELRPLINETNLNASSKFELNSDSLIGVTLGNNSLSNFNPDTGLIVWKSSSLLNLQVGTSIHAILTINLDQLGFTQLPESPDRKLEFYGVAASNASINVDLLIEPVGYDEILLPPTINPVKDVDNKVTGTGAVGATIHITTSTGTYEGLVDADMTYSINIPPQIAGTVITASQTDSLGNASGTTTTTVIATVLQLFVPPEIQFENTLIGFNEVLIHRAQGMENLSVTVHDTRGQGYRWTIKAKAENPMISNEADALPLEALIFVNGGIEVGKLKDGVIVHQGETGAVEDTPVSWGADEGILIKMTPSNVKPGIPYSTTINWTLENAP